MSETMSRPYKGELISIKASGIPAIIEATPEHPFWARQRTCKHLQRRAARKQFPSGWVEAKDLKPGDWLAVPKRKGLEPTELCPDLLYAIGFWLAEGHLIRDWTGTESRGIGLTNSDPELIGRAARALEARFSEDYVKKGNQYHPPQFYPADAKARYVRRQRNNARPIIDWELRSREAGWWFEEHCGRGSDGKFIGPQIFNRSGLLSLVAGYIDGDGSQRAGQQGDVSLYTCSERLAWQLRQILIDDGIWCTLRKSERKPFVNSRDGREIKTPKPQWIINIKASFLGLLPSCKVKPIESRHLRHVMEDEGYFYTPIRQINRREYEGPVYNLAVKTDNSYTAGGVVVHNCGMHDDCVIALALAWWGHEGSERRGGTWGPSLLNDYRG